MVSQVMGWIDISFGLQRKSSVILVNESSVSLGEIHDFQCLVCNHWRSEDSERSPTSIANGRKFEHGSICKHEDGAHRGVEVSVLWYCQQGLPSKTACKVYLWLS